MSVCWAQEDNEQSWENLRSLCKIQNPTSTSTYSDLMSHIQSCNDILALCPYDEVVIKEKAIWENNLAAYLATFSNIYYYEIGLNTPGTPIDSNDIFTWDGPYFNEQILKHFETSIEASNILQKC